MPTFISHDIPQNAVQPSEQLVQRSSGRRSCTALSASRDPRERAREAGAASDGRKWAYGSTKGRLQTPFAPLTGPPEHPISNSRCFRPWGKASVRFYLATEQVDVEQMVSMVDAGDWLPPIEA